jgi:hypothetical protein
MARLDELLSDFDVVERHERLVPARPAMDDRSRRAFRRYRLGVGRFSGVVRRRRLAATERALR